MDGDSSMNDRSVLRDEEICHIDARSERQRELDRKAGLPDWRALESKVIEALQSVAAYEANCSTTMWDNEMRRTIEAREVVVQMIMPLLPGGDSEEEITRLRNENKQLRGAIEGLLMEWDKLTRYGSPMAKAANERVAAARRLLEANQTSD